MQKGLGDFNISVETPTGIPPLKRKGVKKTPAISLTEAKVSTKPPKKVSTRASTMYSHSRLSTFEQCKLKFKFNYIDKLETEMENTIEGFMGSLVHHSLEKLYKDLKYEKLNSKEEIIAFYQSEWEKNYNENIVVVKKDLTAENYRKLGEKCISDYYDRFTPFDQDRTIAVEQRIIIEIEGKKVQGYIDRLSSEGDGVYVIHDYKTSGTLMTQEYADKDRQLALYSIAVKEQYRDCKEVKLVWHYLAFDKDVTSIRTEEQLDELKKDIKGLIDEIETTAEFPPKMSALCDWCQFQPHCPNFKHKFEVEKLDANEYRMDDGVKLVNSYVEWNNKKVEAEEHVKKIKEALVAYCQEHGMEIIQGSDCSALVRSYPSLSFPKKDDPRLPKFVETIKKLGLFDDLAQVNVYELAKRINNKEIHPEFVKVLETFFERGRNDRVYLRKKK